MSRQRSSKPAVKSENPAHVAKLPVLPPRKPDSHKGSYGTVLVVGGSRLYVGAPALAANAALRSGAGLVSVAVPLRIQLTVLGLAPCAISHPLPNDADGNIRVAAVAELAEAAAAADVLAVGPGLGMSQGGVQLVRAALEQDKPLVLDADGLNSLRQIDGWGELRRCPLVMTPHPGEFGRLVGRPVQAVQADREHVAVEAARSWRGEGPDRPGLVVVLKGHGTVVTDGRRIYVNRTGNPGMASGGTGDVLTGMVAALIGQHLELFEAACLAAHVHGLAGDLAAREKGEVSLIASDLLDFLPAAFRIALAGKRGKRSR